jgi:hypothetical protein
MSRSAPSISRAPSAAINRSAPGSSAPRVASRTPIATQPSTKGQATTIAPGANLGAGNPGRGQETANALRGNTSNLQNNNLTNRNNNNRNDWDNNNNNNWNKNRNGNHWYGRQFFYRPGFGWWFWAWNPGSGRWYQSPWSGYGYNNYGYNNYSYAYPSSNYSTQSTQTYVYQDTVEPAGLGLTFNQTLSGGAYVLEVVPGSPAANAGMQPGDVIVAINGGPISSYQEVTGLVGQSKPGDPMKIDFLRGGQTMSVEVYLAARSAVFQG